MSSLLFGIWMFTHILYNGEIQPRPNPDLIMTINFEESGTDILHYYRKGERGTCTREANYTYDGTYLHQKVTSVDPNNSFYCSDDPDMQLGRTSSNVALVKDGKLYLELSMGEDVITYIWTPVDDLDVVIPK